MVALKLTSSELQGQEEAVCVCPAYMTINELFTGTILSDLQVLYLVVFSATTYVVIIEPTHSYYVESVNKRLKNLVPLLLGTSYSDFYGICFPVEG